MWSADCICCSPDTVQQASARSVLADTPSRTGNIAYVQCRCCGSKVCSFCVRGLEECVAMCKKKIPQDDPSIIALKIMALTLKSNDCPKVDYGICCSFRHSIPSDINSTIVYPRRSPEVSILTPPMMNIHLSVIKLPTRNAVAILTMTITSTVWLQIFSRHTSKMRIHLQQ